MSDPGIIYLMGATATGKTQLALDIAARFEIEIVSVDSALVFRGMDIGTAKPGIELRREVPHHLIDILEPEAAFSVWDFVERSRKLAAEINARNRLPLFVGGTMLYFHALQHGLNRLPPADLALREQLRREAKRQGWPQLHARLSRVDPLSAKRIKPNDAQRIQRALEVFDTVGEPLSTLQSQQTRKFSGRIEKIVLSVGDRHALHHRIEKRFCEMLEQGFIDEVVALRARGSLDLSLPSMRCVGYRQLWQYLDGTMTRQQMIAKSLAATRQLAKRQLTWLRKQTQVQAFDCLNYRKDAIFRLIEAEYKRR